MKFEFSWVSCTVSGMCMAMWELLKWKLSMKLVGRGGNKGKENARSRGYGSSATSTCH